VNCTAGGGQAQTSQRGRGHVMLDVFIAQPVSSLAPPRALRKTADRDGRARQQAAGNRVGQGCGRGLGASERLLAHLDAPAQRKCDARPHAGHLSCDKPRHDCGGEQGQAEPLAIGERAKVPRCLSYGGTATAGTYSHSCGGIRAPHPSRLMQILDRGRHNGSRAALPSGKRDMGCMQGGSQETSRSVKPTWAASHSYFRCHTFKL
jgi:hypothetical protein